MTTNCPNCGAPVALETAHCPYCGTLYTWIAGTAPTPTHQADEALRALAAGIMTGNEARALLGLPPK